MCPQLTHHKHEIKLVFNVVLEICFLANDRMFFEASSWDNLFKIKPGIYFTDPW